MGISKHMYGFKDFCAVTLQPGLGDLINYDALKLAAGVIGEDLQSFIKASNSAHSASSGLMATTSFDAIHKRYTHLRSLPTSEVHKIHQTKQGRVHGNYTASEVGGKHAMIGDILRSEHGNKKTDAYYSQNESVDESITNDAGKDYKLPADQSSLRHLGHN